MTDSPAYQLPFDPAEKPILNKVLEIRDHLLILKQDRSTYVKSNDVMKYYNQIIEQVDKLNGIRVKKREEQNRIDTVLDDCFQLISLFFLTVGRNQEAPAVYSAISTVKRLLDHLKEAAFYSGKDLESISGNIQIWERSIEQGQDEHAESLLTFLRARIDVCKATLKELYDYLSKLDPHMVSTHEKLVSILRSLSACNCRSKYPAKEVKELRDQLVEVQNHLHATIDPHEGRTAEEVYKEGLATGSIAEQSNDPNAVVHGLLRRCFLWVEIIEEKKGKIDERFQDTYDKLLKIRNTLEQMNLTHAWSMRETDLYSFQRQLDRVDEARVNGNFVDAEGNSADLHTSRTLLYLLRRSYAYIYQIIISSEPVSEALLPIYNQLLTLKRCLVEVQRSGGVDSPRDVYPYSMKLTSIDNMRKDGKFMVGNDIPEGQGSVVSLLSECFDLAYELRSEADERNNGSADEGTNGVGSKD